ncbi:hypothetical protein [Paenibacillus sp. JCM 10914]|uniref:hypothetical protein n=1 Tax=Paenibacillus sp. JCM 10914 TaxID=1236974 RepID=UPI0003CCA650|nr:hypothetical protein JCM10914_2122 [Paenibacillus sp. JCM 10914]
MQDRNGNWIEGNSAHDWNAREGVFQGYFETDWVAKDNQIEVAFTLTDIRFVGEVEKPLAFDPLQSKQQTVAIEQDGIGSITLQSFEQPEGKTMLKSAIAFTDPQAQENNWVRIQAINGHNEQLKETEPSIYGTPGEHGEILNQQVFQREALLAEGTRFQIAYLADVAKAEGTWSVPMVLSKKQLENGSFKEKLDIALEQVPGGTTIEGMVVTPTQVRLNLRHEEKYSRLPYMDYQLDVGGTLIQGGWWLLSNQPHQSELRFEMAGLDPSALADQPVSLIAKHRVDDHEGDGTPIRLTNISTDKQFISSNVAGHAITWSYYMKEHNLYVESYSADRQFGGVNQTYYLSGDQRNYGKPAFTGMVGDGNNQHTDVYENFEGTELEIFIWRYMTEKPDDELRIQLK